MPKRYDATDEETESLCRILRAFSDAGFINDVVLIGSWCLYFYADIFEGFIPSVRTTDIDFYVPNSKTANAKNLSLQLKAMNYDHFQDTITNKSRFVSPGGFEIEFLARPNRDGLSCVRLGSSGVFAESLSYLDLYNTNYLEIEKWGLCFKIASPSSFVIQKIMIQNRRGAKALKDAQAIKYVSSFIFASRKSETEFMNIYLSLPKKWKRQVKEFLLKQGFDFDFVLNPLRKKTK